jgi:hypothetical protein
LRSIMLVDYKKKLLFIFTYLIVLYWKLRRWQSSISDPRKQCHLCKKNIQCTVWVQSVCVSKKKNYYSFSHRAHCWKLSPVVVAHFGFLIHEKISAFEGIIQLPFIYNLCSIMFIVSKKKLLYSFSYRVLC